MNDKALKAEEIFKSYESGGSELVVLNGVDFTLQLGEKIGVLGASGSGKSTLLNILGGLDKPDRGVVWVSGKRLSDFTEKQLCKWRNESLGFVYQFHHLLPEFSAEENVAMPLLVKGLPMVEAKKEASRMLSRVNLSSRIKHFPSELSGGERQRAAIARALVAKPRCVLMDEPTGNLDIETSGQVLELIDELTDLECAFVLVTHSMDVAARMDKIFELYGGSFKERTQ